MAKKETLDPYANHKLYREWFNLTPGMVRQIVAIKDVQHAN